MAETLKDIIISTSSLSIEAQSNSGPCITLLLLQALADLGMLTACRDPSSRFLRGCDDTVVRPSNQETLNIGPLGLAWRKIIADMPPYCKIIFDLSLPATPKLYWEDATPGEESTFIITQHVMNLVITFPTAIKMRADEDLNFNITVSDQPLRWKLLQTQLLALAEHQKKG